MPSLTYFYIETITSDNIKFKQFWHKKKKKTSWPHIEILMASPLQSTTLEEIQSAKKERTCTTFCNNSNTNFISHLRIISFQPKLYPLIKELHTKLFSIFW